MPNLFRYLVDPSVDTDMKLLADAIGILKGLERFWTQTEVDIGTFDEYGTVSVDDVTPGWAIVLDMALAAFREGIERDDQTAKTEALHRAGKPAPPTA